MNVLNKWLESIETAFSQSSLAKIDYMRFVAIVLGYHFLGVIAYSWTTEFPRIWHWVGGLIGLVITYFIYRAIRNGNRSLYQLFVAVLLIGIPSGIMDVIQLAELRGSVPVVNYVMLFTNVFMSVFQILYVRYFWKRSKLPSKDTGGVGINWFVKIVVVLMVISLLSRLVSLL